ncbi:mediator of RNA polymerase II transcription subunit 15-like [Rhagoletis pomonella]|uniref:mediator of RNA polymerase II transcription subunit 15-like n=1 Tax=Rhagoletis pomonella TaxID=28610 RepID=UPI00177AD58E|nr:mediator of RNA polymerase II transcription subunit 15-like [Rhagoletis pomonella]
MASDKKRSTWSTSDEKVLLDLWAERADDLRRAKRNLHIYADISTQMASKFSAKEVHIKIRNMTQRYREEKKKVGPSGGSPSLWKHFDAVHQIIGFNAANNAEILESFSMDILTSGPQPVPSPSSLASPSPVPQSYPYAAAAPSSTAAHPSPPTAVPSPSPSPQTSSPLSSPVELSSSSPLDTSTAASTSSKRKRNYMGEVVQLAKEQNELLKVVIDDGKVLTAECVNAIKEQSSATKEFISLMKSVLEKNVT